MSETIQLYSKKWLGFIGIALLSFGCYLDYTVVNVALPSIQQELHADLLSLQWIMNIYFLALCILATVIGRLGDLYGRRRFLYLGLTTFAMASLIAGLSTNITWLIVGRLLQGVGAASIFPLGLSLLPSLFPEQERTKAIAIFGSIGGIALALGPILGGIIVSHWGWRWIFFINIPICILGFILCTQTIKESRANNNDTSIDIKGMVLLALTMGGMILSLINSQNRGWMDAITLACLAVGIVCAMLLIKVERQQKNPLVDFKDFKNLMFFSGATLCFLAGVLSAVTLFFDPLYLEVIKAQTPEMAGFILFAIPLAVFIIAFLNGKLIMKLGIINTILIGLTLACIAPMLQLFFTPNTSLSYIIFAFICLGGMWSMGNTVAIIAAQTAVTPDRTSVATGTVVTLFNMGGSIGLAVAVAIYHYVTSHALAKLSDNSSQLNSLEISTLKQLIINPAHALQITLSNLSHNLFNKVFIHGFTGVMTFLFLFSLTALFWIIKWKRTENLNAQALT